ncbi:sodium-dependent transporter [Haloarculaceae archaeon H-GB2-1]|nr:sodium-dependent transporter [Haloarculaceae archaeon H-GB1-1]MEA5387482.1 sodium-dependent transporter [Haloarculaceae archaeon H-GB11]MEA5408963.1 sodium-dependent transporter [Haloarculaceae archaeon H-GB2-1]
MAREKWASRLGFVLASVGSAVGLGNIWRFPFQTATNGGAAFLVVYLVAVVGIGIAALLAEFVVGRRANLNVIGAFEELGHPNWQIAGAIGLFGGFWVLSYYSVIGGWVIRYTLGSVFGGVVPWMGDPLANPVEFFGVASAGPDAVAFHAAFMVLTIGIVAFGVEGGIEKATKVMVPSIAVMLAGLAVFASTLPGAGAGYAYFLSPDLGALLGNLGNVIPAAVGQAMFSLSLGFGVMITYASYIGDDDNLGTDGLSIAFFNTLIGVLAGLVVFPLLFAQNVSPETAGPGAVFVSVPTALAELPAGSILGLVFFGVVLIAALSSAISLLEVVTSYLIDNYAISRPQAATGLGLVIFVLGIPSALDTAWLGWFDGIAVNVVLPLSLLLVVVYVGWVLAGDALDEVQRGTSGAALLGPLWLWTVRTVVLVAILGTLLLGIRKLLVNGGLIPPF